MTLDAVFACSLSYFGLCLLQSTFFSLSAECLCGRMTMDAVEYIGIASHSSSFLGLSSAHSFPSRCHLISHAETHKKRAGPVK